MRNISWCPCLKVRLNFNPRINNAAHFVVYSAVSYLQNNTHGNSRFVSGLAGAIPHKYNVGAFTYSSSACSLYRNVT